MNKSVRIDLGRLRPALLFFLFVLLPLSGAFAGYQATGGPYPGDPLGVRIFTLDNGLTVYLSENHDTPRFYAEIAVRTGSKMDPKESTGLAHYMEHLLFKGSERLGTVDYAREKPLLDRVEALYDEHFHATDPARRSELYQQINQASEEAAQWAIPNELDRVYHTLGAGDFNAHTWHEEVVYQVDLPRNALAQWAVIESDRFEKPVFRLFQTELEAVYEEMNRALDNKMRVIQTAVDARLYKVHPYGQQPTLGTVEDLKNPSLKNLHSFYETWYVPNNMAVFISGDINIDETIKIIDAQFSRWQRRELPPLPSWQEAPLTEREEVRVPFEGEDFVLLAFRTVPKNHPDAPALQVLDMLLDNATAGLINLNLNQAQAVTQAGAFPMQLNDYGAEYLCGTPKPGQTHAEVEQLLLKQLDILKQGAFEDWLLPAIVNDFKRNQKTALESDDSRVDRMRGSWIDLEPWEHAIGFIDRIAGVRREDIVRVANQYFSAGYIAGWREDKPRTAPTVEKPVLPNIQIDSTRASAFADAVLEMPAPPLTPQYIEEGRDYTRKEDGRGITYYHVHNPINDVFKLTIQVELGTLEAPEADIAVRFLDRAGTEKYPAEALQKEWYKLGASFEVSTGDHMTTFNLTGLDENFDASVALMMALLWNASMDSASLDALKGIILQQREDARKDQGAIASALVQYHRYGRESSYLRMIPSDTLTALSSETLQALVRRIISTRQAIGYTGGLSLGEVKRILTDRHPIRGLLDDPPLWKRNIVRAPEKDEIYLVNHPAAAQAHLQLEFGSIPYDPSLSAEVQLYNSYFADGMAGIVFQELREARALAYVAAARYTPGGRKGDQNIMMGLIQTQPDKCADALTAFIDLLDNMPQSADRYAVAREALINSYRTGKIGFRQIIDTVRGWERRGIAKDPRPGWYKTLLDSTDLGALSAFQQQYIAGHPRLISIVGDKDRIHLESLGAPDKIHALTVDDIFVR